MSSSKTRKECEALKTIRGRWQLRGWKFTPLERIDGVNATLESIALLRDSPVCWSSFGCSQNTEQLLDDIETAYRDALDPWIEHRTVFDCKSSQREFLRWPEGTLPASIQLNARHRFWELVTTSRFSVTALPSASELQGVNLPCGQITLRHVASLAAMVCIIRAIQKLERIEDGWREASRPYRKGKPFAWIFQNEPEKMERVLHFMLETPDKIEPYEQLIRDCQEYIGHANVWLGHLEIMNFNRQEMGQSTKAAMARKSEKAQVAAKTLRKKDISVQVVADYFNTHPGKQWQLLQGELAELYKVSGSTVARRHKEAKESNLLS